MLRGILQRLKIAGNYVALKPIGTKGHLSHEKDRWEHKEVLHPLGKSSVTEHAGYSFKA